ncbi:MAG: hypothetical protein ABGY95_11100 [Rubritalea sp.]|uniref:hypothetical protein n=1 Tax=Rubritalea sp. TaxID=2109375 RepID=UPI0032420018
MHQNRITACPHLPHLTSPLPITHTRIHRNECGEAFYIACLELAQSLWINQRPAQAILQLDKAMMAIIPPNSDILDKHPIPYRAMLWIIDSNQSDIFIGNPVRHFQHLASRMNLNQPQPKLRIARAWACFHLAESILNPSTYPRDQRQIEEVKLEIPDYHATTEAIEKLSQHQLELTWLGQAMKSTL